MGYCIEYIDSDFRMKAENKAPALAALVAMWGPGKEADMGGARFGPDGYRYYSWLNDTTLSKGTCPDFETAMREWRYPVDVDEDGNVTGIMFEGEKIGEENLMFAAIGPFVEAGSFVEMSGEDGDRWRFYFDGDRCVEQEGKVSYE